MDNNNSFLQVAWSWIEKYAAGISYVLVAVLGYFAPSLINRWTGKDKAEVRSIERKTDNDASMSIAEAAEKLVGATDTIAATYERLLKTQAEKYEAQILSERTMRQQAEREEIQAKEKMLRQIHKLQQQIDKVRDSEYRAKLERDTYLRQLKQARITPERVPIGDME